MVSKPNLGQMLVSVKICWRTAAVTGSLGDTAVPCHAVWSAAVLCCGFVGFNSQQLGVRNACITDRSVSSFAKVMVANMASFYFICVNAKNFA